mgnify:CR=1 FL=1
MKRKRRIILAVFAVMFAMLCMPQRAEAARKAVWKDVDGVWYAYRGSKLVRNKWVGDYYAGPDGSLVKNQWIGEYFVGEDGKWIENFKGGWYKINKKYYYYTPEGEKAAWLDPARKTEVLSGSEEKWCESDRLEKDRGISLLFQKKERLYADRLEIYQQAVLLFSEKYRNLSSGLVSLDR